MSEQELHPILRDILSQPSDPNAIPVEQQDPEDARTEFESDIAAVDKAAPEMGAVNNIELPGPAGPLPARVYRPENISDTAPLMVFFHGGGNIRGSLETHDSTARVLAASGPCIVVSCRYRLAPESPYPAAVDDAAAATASIAGNVHQYGGDPARIIVAGDSAGGNLAAAVALRARDEGGPELAAQLLIYPVIDHVAETESRQAYSKGYMLDSMPFYTDCYLPDRTRRTEPYASPIHANNFASLPPAVVLTAGFDPLRDEGQAYARALEAAGTPVRMLHYPSMIHGFTLLRGLLEEADQALQACTRAALEMIEN